MAISSLSVFEVRTTGSDTNGGGFVTGSSGTDWSQQNAAQYSVTDAVTAVSTTVTSATASFGTDVVGNLCYIAGGTGSLTGAWYQVATRVNSTTITVDRNLVVGTGATLKIGGALLTIQTAINAAFITSGSRAADCVIYVKAGTYASTVALTTAGSISPSGYSNRILGYNSTRDDNPTPQSGNQPVFAVGSGAGVNGLNLSTSGFIFANLTFDGTVSSGAQGVKGINITAQYNSVRNCKILNFSAEGYITNSQYQQITSCEVT